MKYASPAHNKPSPRKAMWGIPGMEPMSNKIAAAMPNALGEANIWFITCSRISSALLTRVTNIAAAVDNNRDGTCATSPRSEEHTSELQSRGHLVCRLLLE